MRVCLLALGFMTLPCDPRLISSDITVPSLRGSMGGLVTGHTATAAAAAAAAAVTAEVGCVCVRG